MFDYAAHTKIIEIIFKVHINYFEHSIISIYHRGICYAKSVDIRRVLNMGRIIIVLLFLIFVIFSRTSMLRDNPLSGILG